jgi:hypothetical protein
MRCHVKGWQFTTTAAKAALFESEAAAKACLVANFSGFPGGWVVKRIGG